MRKKIYNIIEYTSESDILTQIDDVLIIIAIILSLIPLMFYEQTPFLRALDQIAAAIFILDYILRLITADYKLEKGLLSFVLYPFTPLAILDLIAILPSFAEVAPGFKLLRIFRLVRSLRILRVLKAFRYSDNVEIIIDVIEKQKNSLLTFCYLALAYIFFVALVLFNIEPATFDYKFFNALYWSTVSLTTTGFGDIAPVSVLGRCFTMLSTVVGIAVVALPSGIITAGFMEELEKRNRKELKESEFLKKIDLAEQRARKKLEKETLAEMAKLKEKELPPKY